MLLYKRIETDTLTVGKERIKEILSCPKGKTYKIVSITCDPYAGMFLRVYLGAKQIVDIDSIAMTNAAPLLPMDLSVSVGQVVKAGFFNDTVGNTDARQITIGYKET